MDKSLLYTDVATLSASTYCCSFFYLLLIARYKILRYTICRLFGTTWLVITLGILFHVVRRHMLLSDKTKLVVESGRIPRGNLLSVPCGRLRRLSSVEEEDIIKIGVRTCILKNSRVDRWVSIFVDNCFNITWCPSIQRQILVHSSFIYVLPFDRTLCKLRYSYPVRVPHLQYCNSPNGSERK